MRLLFLAPEPFFQERGTPIAVRLALDVLAKRSQAARLTGSLSENRIDLLTYHEGEDIEIPGVTIHRIWAPKWLKNIGPGISIKKIFCDFIFFFTALRLILKSRNSQYDLIHAVEESVFFAWFFKLIFGIPYIYDMDSCISAQLTEKWFILKPVKPIFDWLERIAVRASLQVVPVCDALAAVADSRGALRTTVLHDISLLSEIGNTPTARSLREDLKLSAEAEIILYIGNLESYQGISLLMDSFSLVVQSNETAQLVIIGGVDDHIQRYREIALKSGIASRVHFLGHRPVGDLAHYLNQAEILVSPRLKGNNTPMKIYSYLHSGKALLATDLPTHTQVLTREIAELAHPIPTNFADGLLRLLGDPVFRSNLGRRAKEFAQDRYTFEVFSEKLNSIYDHVVSGLAHSTGIETPAAIS